MGKIKGAEYSSQRCSTTGPETKCKVCNGVKVNRTFQFCLFSLFPALTWTLGILLNLLNFPSPENSSIPDPCMKLLVSFILQCRDQDMHAFSLLFTSYAASFHSVAVRALFALLYAPLRAIFNIQTNCAAFWKYKNLQHIICERHHESNIQFWSSELHYIGHKTSLHYSVHLVNEVLATIIIAIWIF